MSSEGSQVELWVVLYCAVMCCDVLRVVWSH